MHCLSIRLQCTPFNYGRVLNSHNFRLNSSQASNLSSCASEETKEAPLKYKLSKINEALEILSISEIPESKSKHKEYVNRKIEEIGGNIEEPRSFLRR